MPQPEETDPLYRFGCGTLEPRGAHAEVVGLKALNLIRVAEAGLPVPPGFVLPTSLCRLYHDSGRRLPPELPALLTRGIRELETATGLSFGGNRRPLLLAVRSGAPVSMPGMMDTLLNVGLCERTLPALIRMTGNPHHAWDSYRRLVQTYAEVVNGLPADPFERLIEERLAGESVASAAELDVVALKELTRSFLEEYRSLKGESFPDDLQIQLTAAVEAVLRSWESQRAVEYRKLRGLDNRMGTAVTIQAMVFGNMGGTSGSGVAFTRDPATGDKTLYLDFLAAAQGEDLVSGRCLVPASIDLQRAMPELVRQLQRVGRELETLFQDVQDFEFTIQEGKLHLLQSRAAKRTAWAELRTACDLVEEGLINRSTALERLAGLDLSSIELVRAAPSAQCQPIAQGIAASPGVAVGEVVLDAQRGLEHAARGAPQILVRADISTSDIAALASCAGVLTARGGRTSHAAVVARQLGKPCVVGCQDLIIPDEGRTCQLAGEPVAEGSILSLDGSSGRVYSGRLEVIVERPTRYLLEVERWKSELATAIP